MKTQNLMFERFVRDCHESDLPQYLIDESTDIGWLIDKVERQTRGWRTTVRRAEKLFLDRDVLCAFAHQCEYVAGLERAEYQLAFV